MLRGIYATASGMAATEQWMDAVANNLANVSTNGYKRDAAFFNEALERTLLADGGRGPRLGSLGVGPAFRGIATVFEQGPLQPTGNPLDLAIDAPDGAFAVRDSRGRIRFTRDGSFRVDSEGRLTTQRGELVLDDRLNEIELPVGQVSVDADGTVRSGDRPVGTIGVFNARFIKAGGNLFVAGGNPQPVEEPRIKVGFLEGSNVNPIGEMVELIRLNRSFELAHRSVVKQDELMQRLIQSLQNR
ncbi:MAG: flagellar hook-basal body protein [Fimbriimonadales bacterium]|nr:flagellar hook-basal body protein [Fimbriimonadales bacterium]